jgi:hypothetical protein
LIKAKDAEIDELKKRLQQIGVPGPQALDSSEQISEVGFPFVQRCLF